MRRAQIDPELRRQLDAATGTGLPVGAVFSLRLPADKRGSGADVESAIRGMLARVTREVGVPPQRFHIFKSVGSFVVSASASYVETLLLQKELATAMANEPSQDLLIRPVEKRAADPRRPRRKR